MWILLATLLGTITPAAHLARGQQLLDALEYQEAADELMTAAVDPAATDAERLRANMLAGIAHRVVGRDVEARTNFRYVLLRDPAYRLSPDAPPKVTLFFESVRQELTAENANAAHLATSATPTTPAPSTIPVAAIAGGTAAGVGVLGALAGLGGVAYAETSLADPTRPGSARTELRSLGAWSTGGAALGVVVAGAGAALFFLSSAP